MSALDDLLAEVKAHPKIVSAIAANATAGQLLADDASVAHVLKAVGGGVTFDRLVEDVAGLFERLQTGDGHAVELHDQAELIAGRADLSIGHRLIATMEYLAAAPAHKLRAIGIPDDNPRRLQ
jgi:hypothetical protein